MPTQQVIEFPRTFAYHVAGDAMEPEFHIGDEIFVDCSQHHPHSGDFVIAQLDKQSAPVFRQFIEHQGKHFLKSLNPNYPIIEIAADTFIRGVIVFRGNPLS